MMNKNFALPYLLLSLLLFSCSGISLLQRGGASNLYGQQFLEAVEEIKLKYRQGDAEGALADLQVMEEETLLPSERALRRNLIGVIHFSQNKMELAIFNFDLALTTSRLDRPLTAQIYLNLASSYYRMQLYERAHGSLALADFKLLQKEEAKKYHRLNYQLATELNRPKDQMTSLIWYLFDKNSVSELRDEPLYQELVDKFFALDRREQLKIINDFDRDELFVVGYLAYLTVERLYYQGEKREADGLIRWIQRRYKDDSEVAVLLSNFLFRTESFAQMDQFTIGVILPLSGEKQAFGERVIKGIDTSLQKYTSQLQVESGGKAWPYKLLVKDSEGSPAIGAYQVQDLIENNKVSIIIGGLFSDEALRQYQEARKYGAFFISLSEVFLPKEEKDHLLLEIPGSVESQLAHLFSSRLLENYGKRGAILYPNTPRGESYVNEFWRRANLHGVNVAGLISYEQGQTDFKDPVENILGLKFKRQRQEELDLLSELYTLEGNRSARRVQILEPQIDFDWIYLAAFPREALQMIPYFTYYDAVNLNIIGGPSWRSQALATEGQRLGTLTFIGDHVGSGGVEFTQKFTEVYGESPRLIEMRSHDAFDLAHKLISQRNYSNREEFNMDIRNSNNLTGLTGEWFLDEGIWIKKMSTYNIRRGRINSVFSEDTSGASTEVEEDKLDAGE